MNLGEDGSKTIASLKGGATTELDVATGWGSENTTITQPEDEAEQYCVEHDCLWF